MENNIFQSIFKVTHSGGSGSCFYLKSHDLFVTNYHVVEGYRTVAIHDNDRNPYLAHVVVVNPLCWPPRGTSRHCPKSRWPTTKRSP